MRRQFTPGNVGEAMEATKKILLIDDEQIMHDLAFAYLDREGFQLLSAYSGEKGLKMILEERPDVVLLDYMMPGMNGEEVFNEMRRNPRYKEVRDTPVIFLSARGGDRDLKQRLMKRGIIAYLQKPFGLRELSDIIDNVFIVNEIRLRNRQLRQEITVTRDLLVQIVQNVPVGIFTTNGSGEIILANRVMQTLFPGASAEEFTQKNIFESPRLAHTFIAEGVKQVLDTGKSWRKTNIRWQPGGREYRLLEAKFVPLGIGIQREGVVGLVQDVTAQMRHQYEMQMLAQITFAMQQTINLEQLLHVILTAITAGPALGFTRAMIFLVDERRRQFYGAMGVGPMDKKEAHRVWTALEKENLSLEEFLQKYGYKLPEATDRFNRFVRSIRFPLHADCALTRAVLDRKPFTGDTLVKDCSYHAPLEKLRLKDFICVPLVTGNRLVGFILADNRFSERTIPRRYQHLLQLIAGQAASAIERVNAYRQLAREKQKLERALQDLKDANERLIHSERLAAIGEMAAHVAHEIRNPLVTIGGYARQLKKQCEPDSQIFEASDIIAEEVERLERILANVLNFTKLPRPELALASIDEIIRDVYDQLKYEFERKQIQLEIHLQPDIPQFYFDPEKIKQVLLNLLRNSEQSMESGGVIGIEAYASGKDICITVSDNGGGIPQDQLEMIFNPFYTTKEHGTGLGLAISQQIIHDHGGDILVYSEVGVGTVFKILLPLDTQPQTRADSVETLGEIVF